MSQSRILTNTTSPRRVSQRRRVYRERPVICTFFSKKFADSFLQCVEQGKPIAPPPDPVTGNREWTANNMLSLAGLLVAAASRREPREFRDDSVIVEDKPVVTAEDRERVRTLHDAELHAAIDFLNCIATSVWDGEYPPSWDADMNGWIDEEPPMLPQDLPLFHGDEPKRAC